MKNTVNHAPDVGVKKHSFTNLIANAACSRGASPAYAADSVSQGEHSRQHTDSTPTAHRQQRQLPRFFRYVASILFLLCFSIGSVWGATTWQTTTVDAIQGVRDSISADGLQRGWNFVGTFTNNTNFSTTGELFHEIFFKSEGSAGKVKIKKESSGDGKGISCSNQSHIYIPVPSGAEGTVSIAMYSSSKGRWLQLYKGNPEATGGTSQRLYSQYNATEDEGKGPQSFAFTSADIVTLDTKTYLHFRDNGSGEMKISGFAVTLTTGNYPIGGGGSDPEPSCDEATVSFSATSTAIEIAEGESSASTTLTFSSDNESTAVYAVTKGGAATSDASVTGTTFTATAKGTYVVTVTQAKDETNNICAVEKTVTITVTDANSSCPTEGTVYKFVGKTGLTNGTVSETGVFDITTSNYLSEIEGGTLQGYNNNSKFQIADNKSFKLTDKTNSYLKVDLGDCQFEEGDVLKYIITSQNVELYLSTSKTSSEKVTLTKSSNSSTYAQYTLTSEDSPVGKSAIYIYGASNSPQVYSFEVIRPYTITLDATTNGGSAIAPVKGTTVGDKVVLPHAFKSGKKFKGWYDAPEGGTKQADYYTVSASTTLYAQFEDLPASGTMFSLTMESSMKPASEVSLKRTETVNLLTYATISGGAAIFENIATGSDNNGKITTSGEIDWNANNALMTLNLDFPLAAGDVISFVSPNSYELSFTTEKTRATTPATSSKSYTIPAESALIGKTTLYVWRVANSETKVTSFTITRPVTYQVSFNMHGHGDQVDSQSLLEGDKVTAPATTDIDGWDFGGWYQTYVASPESYSNAWDFANDVVGTSAIVLHAKWTAHVTSADASLASLTANGISASVDPLDATKYTVELPMGTSVAPDIVATPTDDNAEATVASNTLAEGATIVVVPESGEGDKVTYTLSYTIATSKDIELVWATNYDRCDGTRPDAVVKIAAMSQYLSASYTGTAAEGGSLNTGKTTGSKITITAKPGYAFQAMSFYGKIEDGSCKFYKDGVESTIGTATSDKCYDVFTASEVHEFAFELTGSNGIYIRNMQLTIVEACTPKTIAWSTEPAAEYEVGKSATAIAATANNGTVAYATSDGDVIAVNASTGALTVSALGAVTLSASVPAGDGTTYCNEGAGISKANVKTYYLVQFDAQNGDAISSAKYYSGDDAIALPSTPSFTGHTFRGWFDAATGGTAVTSAITPTASRIVYAQWEAECAGPTITTQPVGANYLTGRTAAPLTCQATAGAAGELTYTWYSCDDTEKTNPVALAGAPTPSTAAAGTFYYYCVVAEAGCAVEKTSNVVTVTVADKDPVCIIKATPTSATEATADGVYKGSAAFKGNNSKKLNTKYDYVAVQLMDGKTFLATDKVVLNQTADLSAGDISKFYVFTETPADGKTYATVDNASPVKGDNAFTMPAELAGQSALYIGRINANCNPTVGYLAVYRAMAPEMTAITINGREGVVDALDDKHFTVTIPYEADLASLTVVSNVIRNAAHATTPETVVSNEGAWVLTADGDNTYRVMDKDGDYTDYTITLVRDVQKFTVSFNTHGGSAVADEEVVAGESLASAPSSPTKEDYIFQGWAETDGGAIVDVTSFAISADKEFHAVWASDGAIKLLNGSTVNHANFITGVTASKVTISDIEYDCVAFAGTVGSSVNTSNIKNLDRLVAYNATTTQTKMQLSLYNSNGSNKRTIYVKGVIEGAEEETPLATIELNGGENRTTDWIVFNNAANRTIYIFVSGNAGEIKILQEKVIETGDELKMAGEAGYSINLNKGRIFGASGATLPFEGMSYAIIGDYTTLSSSAVKIKSTSIVFDASAEVTLQVTANDKTYYVTKGEAGTDNATTKSGLSEFDLTAGTWYITAGGSEVQITNIAFAMPKCVLAITGQPASNNNVTVGQNLTATVVASSSTDGATLAYQWFDASTDEEVEGATAATLTTTTPGTYYVKVTASKDGYQSKVLQSDAAVLAYRDNTIATLSVLSVSTGTLSPAFDAEETEYRVDLPMGTIEVPTLTATATQAAYGATAAVSDATEFVDYEAVSTVLVTAEDGTTTKTYTVHFYVDHIYTSLVPVTGDMTWNFSKISGFNTAGAFGSEDIIMANVDGMINNPAVFESDNIMVNANKMTAATNGKLQASMIKFHSTVNGIITVVFSNTGSKTNYRYLVVNGLQTTAKSKTSTTETYKMFVPAGDVVLTVTTADEGNMFNFTSLDFKAKASADYERVVTNNIGTLCVDHNVLAGGFRGATFYQIASRNEISDYKIDFEEVAANEELNAGEPYIFQSTTGKIELYYGETVKAEPEAVRGMHGVLEGGTLDITTDNMQDIIYIANNKLYNCTNLVGTGLTLVENRAYIVMSQVPTYQQYQESQNNANNVARRRVTIGMTGTNVTTDVEDVQSDEVQCTKVLIDGQLFILRGEKMYDAKGMLVK